MSNLSQKERMLSGKRSIFDLDSKVTLLAFSVGFLASILLASNSFAADVNSSNTSSYTPPFEEPEKPKTNLSASLDMSRSTNLYDHQDGSRGDSLDFRLILGAAFTNGHSLSMVTDYSNNLRDSEDTAAGLYDPSLKYSFQSKNWAWSAPYILTLRPSLSTVIPVTDRSTIRDQLQGTLSGGIAFGIKPDGIYKSEGTWTVTVGLTAGRNFHTYEEDINGKVLNKYSSNQSLDIGYSIGDFSFSMSYLHRSRWTYQGNIRDSFAFSEEIGYSLNDNFAVNIGHSNEGAMVKANGYESNLQLVDENNSTVYMGIGASL
jgi:hypothetical protein